jgi:hypothetical protein
MIKIKQRNGKALSRSEASEPSENAEKEEHASCRTVRSPIILTPSSLRGQNQLAAAIPRPFFNRIGGNRTFAPVKALTAVDPMET